ncbi:cysteine desulfurase [Propionimicrobium sp. PCR01-08-3]|uniref:cysteine desulfurase n=1 Tax=Propionimicrobium sp. PCR01-08-3 TaxID=3052086 RepID=UPI00255CEA84|nr:cysteine desulfurase [Propionimicrobium sp. PCR01-08-3]WIY81610.1 cysteine desulfurase [Propionimicrobium sp. PCR01-08-3]
MWDSAAIRADFPILDREVDGHRLVYLDSANTSQKPREVVEAVEAHYLRHNANVARAMHTLGAEATAAFEGARAKVAEFIHAARPEEVVFTKNASEALNLAAYTLGSRLKPGDEVVISVLEHHSNLVPWQLACEASGATLRWFDVTDEGRLDLDKAQRDGLINEHTKVVSVAWVSNVLGSITPVRQIADWAHSVGAIMVADGSQGVPQRATDVNALGVDLMAFTGHKLCGPTGIGVLWGRFDLLDSLPPFLGGGEMIEVVRMERSTYAPPPHRFEAGTPPIAQAVGLGAAIDYLSRIGMEAIADHENEITAKMLAGLGSLEGVRILGPTEAVDRGGAVSFTVEGVHPHDLMQLLDSRGVAVRGGHHCAAPLHQRLGVQSSSRASGYLYTTPEEVDALIDAVAWAYDFFNSRTGRRHER